MMSDAEKNPGRRMALRWLRAGMAFLAVGLLAGCAGAPRDWIRGAGYRPDNIFVQAPTLPAGIRRVAVLPLVCDKDNFDLSEGRTALEPILREALIQTREFEVVFAGPQFLQGRTGHGAWSGEEPLPEDFFSALREQSGCDAVLFSRLTVFRAYPPLAIGWRMKLVDARTRQTLWAADEVFDAGVPAVADGARRHQLAAQRETSGIPDEWLIRNSPRRFGQYAAARLLATLPAR